MSKGMTKAELQWVADNKLENEVLYEGTITYRFLSSKTFGQAMRDLEEHSASFATKRRIRGYIEFKVRDLPRKDGRRFVTNG